MKELVVISGKGGTGKTSIVAAFAALAESKVLGDCDVDAPDLHLVLEPAPRRQGEFSGGKRARVLTDKCVGCGKCAELCRFDAISLDGPRNSAASKTYRIDPLGCEGCGVCARFCPADAIAFEAVVNGRWFVSDTRLGPMVHARLGVAEENSGKLVNLVRKEARELAESEGLELILIDGPPGIGCPVIASLTGASQALIVTEPTLSGLHDLERARRLTAHFELPTFVCVNKFDLNPDLTERIEREAREMRVESTARVRFDPEITRAQIARESVVERGDSPAAVDVRALWEQLAEALAADS
jgi:MinD superfamily P-loop ATPase